MHPWLKLLTLSKYISAKNKVFSEEEQEDVSFLFNIETSTAYSNVDEMLKIASQTNGSDGVVFGRVDFGASLGTGRDGIDSSAVQTAAESVALGCKNHGLDFVVGGGISVDALRSLRSLREIYLNRYETRKVVFGSSSLDLPNLADALRQAVHFELLWLLNKREYYGVMHKEDTARINLLENRWKVL